MSTYSSWREAARLLAEDTGPATPEQLTLATLTGLPAKLDVPRRVLAVQLEDHLAPAIHGAPPRVATERQLAFLECLVPDRRWDCLTVGVASSWIEHYLALGSIAALHRLKLERGMTVLRQSACIGPDGRSHESFMAFVVSSIGRSGLVYFLGGNGQCGWPMNLQHAELTSGSWIDEAPPLA